MRTDKVEVVDITPSFANDLLNSCSYQYQRGVNENHVDFLAQEMARGRFSPTAQVVTASIPSGRRFIINGQHTLRAIRKSGLTQRITMFSVFFDTEREVAEEYGKLDVGKPRSFMDQLSPLNLTDEFGLNVTNLRALVSAAKMITSNFGDRSLRVRAHVDDVERVSREYANAAHDFFSIGRCDMVVKSLYRAATVSVALVTYRFSAKIYGIDKINDFWQGAIFDDGILRGDPRKVAHEHFLFVGMTGSGNSGGQFTKYMSAAQSARYIARCFNDFVDGKQLMRPQIPSGVEPMVIKGSPFYGIATKAA